MPNATVAVRTGFEPAIPEGILAFQTSALNHSATSPKFMAETGRFELPAPVGASV